MSRAGGGARGTPPVLATLAALIALAGCATATPPFRTADGSVDPRSIAEETRLEVILGRHDQRTSSELAARYLETLRAPAKRLVWLERSAHNVPFEEPEAFRAAVLDAIAPRARPSSHSNDSPRAARRARIPLLRPGVSSRS